MEVQTTAVVVGTGVSGLFCALHLPQDWPVLLLSKSDLESSDSFLAQGGMCVLPNEEDYHSFYEDTMRAGHSKNRPESVAQMIRGSQQVVRDLEGYGVRFTRGEDGGYLYTREGGHSRPRILFYQDITGQEITSKLLKEAKKRPNLTLLEYTTMTDLLVEGGVCRGIRATGPKGQELTIRARNTVLATGGIGGRFPHSTNFSHLTGDALDLAQRYHIRTQDLDYIQFHPTALYSERPGRRFLISESVRGEGGILLNHKMERFVDELLPRDRVAAAIWKEMEREGQPFMWLSMEHIPPKQIFAHFPNIHQRCLEEGYDVTATCVPVVPAQHYFMGGIWVDQDSRTSMEGLYAVGETSCNGVHGANRLASNSLLESMVFARAAAAAIIANY